MQQSKFSYFLSRHFGICEEVAWSEFFLLKVNKGVLEQYLLDFQRDFPLEVQEERFQILFLKCQEMLKDEIRCRNALLILSILFQKVPVSKHITFVSSVKLMDVFWKTLLESFKQFLAIDDSDKKDVVSSVDDVSVRSNSIFGIGSRKDTTHEEFGMGLSFYNNSLMSAADRQKLTLLLIVSILTSNSIVSKISLCLFSSR